MSMKLQSEAPQSHCDVEQPDSFTYLHSFKGFFTDNFFPGISRDSRDCPLNFPFPGNRKMGGKLETLTLAEWREILKCLTYQRHLSSATHRHLGIIRTKLEGRKINLISLFPITQRKKKLIFKSNRYSEANTASLLYYQRWVSCQNIHFAKPEVIS